jgi:hypothetical protein
VVFHVPVPPLTGATPLASHSKFAAVGDAAAQGNEMELGAAELRDPSKRGGELLAQLAS